MARHSAEVSVELEWELLGHGLREQTSCRGSKVADLCTPRMGGNEVKMVVLF